MHPINRKAEELWGRKRETLLGTHYWTEFPEAVGSGIYVMHQKVVNEGVPVHYETISPHLNRWIEASIYPNGPGGVSCYFRDISERKENEQVLRQTSERLRMALDAGRIFSWEMNPASRQLEWSANAEHVIGFPLLSNIDKTFELIHPDDVHATVAAINTAIERNGHYDSEYRLVNPANGDTFWLHSQGSMATGAGGQLRFLGVTQNVTERKLAQEALERQTRIFDTTLNSITDFAYIFDREGRFVYSNRPLVALLGISQDDIVGKNFFDLNYPNELAARHHNEIQEVISTGRLIRNESHFMSPTGFDGYYEYIFSPVFDNEGLVDLVAGSTRDVTGRKRIEESLAESEERLRITMESAVDYAIINIDTKGRIEGWSRGAERTFGWTEMEVTGKSVDIIFTPEDLAAGIHEQEIETAIAQGSAPDERWHIRKDGSRFFMSGVTRPIYDGVLRGFVKVARDLTDRRHAEEILRVSEERYRVALQSADMGAWDWNVTTDKITWNEQQYLMLGIQPQSAPRDTEFFLNLIHPDDREYVYSALLNAVQLTGAYQAEFRILRADTAEVRWMAGFGRAVMQDEESKAMRIIGVMYDITQRKHTEEQKEQFIGIASHELKTPVTTIKAYAEVLREMFEDAGDAHSADLMGKLDTQVDRLTGLIHELLDTTRITGGQLVLNKERLPVDELIAEVAESMQRTTAKHALTLSLTADCILTADRDRIRQVLLNIIGNAIKYSPAGGDIQISSGAGDGLATICVHDRGIGMSAETQAQVFARFYRSSDPETATYPGLGLGMFISAEIVREHGGQIWVKSEKGNGATFCFTLPLD